jgi:flavin-binding protein dodecin
MSDNIHKVEEIVGTSEAGLEEAIEGAVSRREDDPKS